MGKEMNRPAEEDPSTNFDFLVEKYMGFVYNIAYRMMENAADAEDATQDAFLSAFRAFDRFRGESQVSTWLYRITVNACLMKLRKEKKSRLLTQNGYDEREIVDWAEGGFENPERSALNTELRERLDEGISRLPPDLRAAVVIRDLQGLSNIEAAESLDITVSAVKARLHRGRVLLRKFLGDYVKSTG